MVITRDDILVYFPFSKNIENRILEPYILASQNIDLLGLVGGSLRNDLLNLDEDNDPQPKPQLLAFLNDFVKPYIVHATIKRMAVGHGYNWAAQGIIAFSDPTATSQGISPQDRSSLIKAISKDRDFYKNAALNELEDKDMRFDKIDYNIDRTEIKQSKSNTIGLSSIKSKRISDKKFI